jgi:hypothetical protein
VSFVVGSQVVISASASVSAHAQLPSRPDDAPQRLDVGSAVRLHVAARQLVGRVRSIGEDTLAIVSVLPTATEVHVRWRLGADVAPDSVVLRIAWSDITAVDVATGETTARTNRALWGAAGLAGALGAVAVLLDRSSPGTGARTGTIAAVVGAAFTGGMLGASSADRRFTWRAFSLNTERAAGVSAGGGGR